MGEAKAGLDERGDVRRQELAAASEALARERAQFEAVFRQMPGGIVVADAPSERILLANDEARAVFGVEPGAAVAVRGYTGYSRAGTAYATDDWPLVRALRRGETVDAELIEMRRDDGSSRVVEVSASPVRGVDGTIVAGVVTFHDVTDRERRERAEREFVQNAAHQLRTPLAAITSAIEVLQGGAKEDPVARDRFLGHIERESHRLARLARALLVLARAQTAQEAPALDVLELEPLLQGIASGIQGGASMPITVDCEPGAAAIANRDLTEEALSSLLSNAIRYTESGGIVLSARTSGSTVTIAVADTGSGIPPEVRQRLFGRFVRGEGTDGGFGLGLAIAHQAVSAMRGSLEVDEQPGGGTVARLTLRAAKVLTT